MLQVEVDDVLVYTFDQGAWLCSEFGPCPRCSGVPLDERVPGFLNLLNSTMQQCRPGTTLWWKPWELSKGQVVAILDKVKPARFGLAALPTRPASGSAVLQARSMRTQLIPAAAIISACLSASR